MNGTNFSVTLEDVAKAAGVSIATVSRALNGSSLIASLTRERILKIAEEAHYVPNPCFRAMGKAASKPVRGSGYIGILAPTISFWSNSYYGRMLSSMETAIRKASLNLAVCSLDAKDPEYVPSMVSELKVDAIILNSVFDTKLIRRIQSVVPAVSLNTSLPEGLAIQSVVPDERAAIRKALDYLRGLGHERIVYFDIHDTPEWHHKKRAAAFSEFAGPGAKTLVLKERTMPMSDLALKILEDWRAGSGLPSALLCAADYYAFGFLDAARRLGISVPGELSIVGIDNLEPCDYVWPRLTSIRQPLEKMSAFCVELLLKALEGKGDVPSSSTHFFDVDLVVRDSCAPPKMHGRAT